ncbi:hypothetical protein GCM10023178_17310 [Actinomadura luteofluorescens]
MTCSRHAATAACAVTAAQIVLAVWGTNFPEAPYAFVASSVAGVPLLLALLATASLVASPGPRHGARLLGRARVAGAAAMAGVLVALSSQPLFSLLLQGDLGVPGQMDDPDRFYRFAQMWSRLQLVAVLVVAVLACAALSRSGQGRRTCALLALAGLPLLIRVAPFHVGSLAGLAVTMLCVRLVELPLKSRASGRPGKA